MRIIYYRKSCIFHDEINYILNSLHFKKRQLGQNNCRKKLSLIFAWYNMWFDERHIRKGSRKGNKSLSLFVVSAGVLNKMYAKITRYAAILFSTRPLGSALLQYLITSF